MSQPPNLKLNFDSAKAELLEMQRRATKPKVVNAPQPCRPVGEHPAGNQPRQNAAKGGNADGAPGAPSPPQNRSFIMPPVPHFVRLNPRGEGSSCLFGRQNFSQAPPNLKRSFPQGASPAGGSQGRPKKGNNFHAAKSPPSLFENPLNTIKNFLNSSGGAGIGRGLLGGGSEGFSVNKILRSLGSGGAGSDRMLILLLIALLSGEGSDRILIFALLYIML